MEMDKFKMLNPFIEGSMSRLPSMTLPAEEYKELIGAIKELYNYGIFWPNTGGFTVNGRDYIPIDLLSSPDELKKDLDVINTFFNKNFKYTPTIL